MYEQYIPRTDLAIEENEKYKENNVEIQGIEIYEDLHKDEFLKITEVRINDKKAAKEINRDIGSYITIEFVSGGDEEEYFCAIYENLVRCLEKVVDKKKVKKLLVTGLGNRMITPDAIGPMVVDNINVTVEGYYDEEETDIKLYAFAPGVMAQTGIETSEIIKGVISKVKPDMIIAVDALAARSISRVNKTIQITDTGISPGSGVGNNRAAINKNSMGVEVVAIGVPTVTDALTISNDVISNILKKSGLSEKENEIVRQKLFNTDIENMIVTSNDVDEYIFRLSKIIAKSINTLCNKKMTV